MISTVPRSVPSATALESGIECVICTISIENGPSSIVSAIATSFSETSRNLCSSSFDRAIAIVSAPPYTGGRRADGLAARSSRNTHGSAPRWSSWPCVITIASMSFARSRR